MQAVIELAMNVIAALALAVMAQLGVDTDRASDEPARPERVVARTPRAEAAPTAPQHAQGCPDAPVPIPLVV